MKTKQKKTKTAVSVLVLAGLVFFGLTVIGGDLEPSGPPGPTMKTLDEIYNAVVSESSGILEREGFCQSYEIDPNSSETCFTVPTGKRFVLLKAYLAGSDIGVPSYLTVNDNVFILGNALPAWATGGTFLDFPDRCAVVDAGETLKVGNIGRWDSSYATIVGYFYSIQ